MPSKILLKLYDVDRCLYHSLGDSKNIDSWLIESNKKFLEHEISKIKESGFNTVIIAYGTNRQDYVTDQANSYRGGSCIPMLPILHEHFSKHLDCAIYADTFLMADIYGQKKAAGESYNAIVRHQNEERSTNHAEWMFDQYKLSLIYAHAHRVAALHSGSDSKITIEFFDDHDLILNQVFEFFNSYPQLLPNNVTLCVKKYAGDLEDLNKFNKQIIGTGLLDAQYPWTVRYISSKTYHFSSSASEDRNISTFTQLEKYHNDDHYHHTSHKMGMSGEQVDVSKLMTFRELELSKLGIEDGIVNAGYTQQFTKLKDVPSSAPIADNSERVEEHVSVKDNSFLRQMPPADRLFSLAGQIRKEQFDLSGLREVTDFSQLKDFIVSFNLGAKTSDLLNHIKNSDISSIVHNSATIGLIKDCWCRTLLDRPDLLQNHLSTPSLHG